MDATALIQNLHLQAHPKGGYYRETFRSEQNIEFIGALIICNK
ncbi:MAG: cupin domain-containing protein [Bacteroidia bacterium]|nr:cupin domain-containing protein [Bacteroidia bacterium]